MRILAVAVMAAAVAGCSTDPVPVSGAQAVPPTQMVTNEPSLPGLFCGWPAGFSTARAQTS